MKNSKTVLLYEFKNAIHSRWLYAYVILLAVLTFGITYLADNVRRIELSLINVLILIVPLVSIMFTVSYWYNSEKFTELLLSQPVSRFRLFHSRLTALLVSLAACLVLGLLISGLSAGIRGEGLLWLFAVSVVCGSVFCLIGACIATVIQDRMWGTGLALLIWIYFSALHDGIILILLYWFRDYPLELFSTLVCSVNPLGLARVTLLMHFDAPLLLGHSGAMVRKLVETGQGYWYAVLIAFLWLALPAFLSRKFFLNKDF